MEIIETKTRPKIEVPKLYHAVLLNDDYTSVEFVIHILITHFGKNREEATNVAFETHTKGRSIAGTYTREIAETKIAAVEKEARAREYPLRMDLQEA